MRTWIVTVYSQAMRGCYTMLLQARDAAEAWVHAEWILGCDCGCTGACVHQVKPA